MLSSWRTAAALAAVLLALSPTDALAGDEHWSRQFKRPARTTSMGPGTGLADGAGKATVTAVK